MSEIKLLPCPFCGGEARIRDCTREEQTTIVNGQMHKMCGCKHYCVEMFGYTEEEAIEKWNTRKPIKRIVEKIEDLDIYFDNGDFATCDDALVVLKDVLQIVKEEGGIE